MSRLGGRRGTRGSGRCGTAVWEPWLSVGPGWAEAPARHRASPQLPQQLGEQTFRDTVCRRLQGHCLRPHHTPPLFGALAAAFSALLRQHFPWPLTPVWRQPARTHSARPAARDRTQSTAPGELPANLWDELSAFSPRKLATGCCVKHGHPQSPPQTSHRLQR